MSAYTPEFIRAMEKQFGEEFGINITLENEPGHASREIPPKMIQAQKVGKGLVDYIDGGNPSNFAPLMQQDALQKAIDGVTSLEEIIRVCSGGTSE